MRALAFALDILRIPVAICVLMGLAGIFLAGGDGAFTGVLKLIASGILMNGAIAWLLILLWRRYRTRTSAKLTNEGDL